MITPARQALEATACAPAEGSAELPNEPMCVKTCCALVVTDKVHHPLMCGSPLSFLHAWAGVRVGTASRGRYKSDLTNQRRNLRPWRPSGHDRTAALRGSCNRASTVCT